MQKYFARFFMSNQNTEKTHNSCLESHLSIKVNSCCCFTCWQLLWKKKNTFLNFMPELFYGRPIIFQGLYSTKNSSKMLQKIYHILSIGKLFPFFFMGYLSFPKLFPFSIRAKLKYSIKWKVTLVGTFFKCLKNKKIHNKSRMATNHKKY